MMKWSHFYKDRETAVISRARKKCKVKNELSVKATETSVIRVERTWENPG